jgi:hypothetical protein
MESYMRRAQGVCRCGGGVEDAAGNNQDTGAHGGSCDDDASTASGPFAVAPDDAFFARLAAGPSVPVYEHGYRLYWAVPWARVGAEPDYPPS